MTRGRAGNRAGDNRGPTVEYGAQCGRAWHEKVMQNWGERRGGSEGGEGSLSAAQAWHQLALLGG
eukprot:2226009-Pyramimonas_sp.AAC.1